jgi:hypothetical protein
MLRSSMPETTLRTLASGDSNLSQDITDKVDSDIGRLMDWHVKYCPALFRIGPKHELSLNACTLFHQYGAPLDI